MSRTRTPTAADLASLSRDEWEALGHDLCAVLYDADRVEDRLGRGNGLDAVRQLEVGGEVDGWQFKRFDDRLGNKQIVTLRAAVDRAVEACRRDLSGALTTFTVFGNIDLQPGHGTAKGEDARFSEFREWCQFHHDVKAVYRDVTWVRARLLKYPNLRPALFEDIPAALKAVKEEILAAVGGGDALRDAFERLKAESAGQVSVLVAEATLHFDRGRERGKQEEWLLAIQSLKDAKRLASAPGMAGGLLTRIRTVLTGLLYVTGRIGDAVSEGRNAVAAAASEADAPLLRLARGNLALSLSDMQEHDEARALFLEVLRMDEDAAERSEIVRTLTNLLHVDVERRDWKQAAVWADRLERKVHDLDREIGPTETSMNALGNIATFHLNTSLILPEHLQAEGFRRAAALFRSIAASCRSSNLRRTAILAEGNIARTLWYLKQYDDADAAFERAIDDAGDELGKVSADSRYNQAEMLAEAGRSGRAETAALDALRRYRALGDQPSARDAEQLLARVRSERGDSSDGEDG